MSEPTARELQLLIAFRRLRSRKLAAAELGITDATAAVHLRRLYPRLGAHSYEEAVEAAEFLGVIPQESAATG